MQECIVEPHRDFRKTEWERSSRHFHLFLKSLIR